MKYFLVIISAIFFQLNLSAQCNEESHSNNPNDSWLSCAASQNPNTARGNSHWVKYDLGYIYPITSSRVWNYNVSGETEKGFKDVVIDYSLDGITWIELGTYVFDEASGSNVYNGFEGPNFNDTKMKYILITALNNHGNANCFGFSEFKFNIGDDVIIGLQELEDDYNLSVFPNPTKDILNLMYENIQLKELSIRNAAGYEMKRFQEEVPNSFDVSYLSSGIYFIIAFTENNKQIVRKFTVENNK